MRFASEALFFFLASVAVLTARDTSAQQADAMPAPTPTPAPSPSPVPSPSPSPSPSLMGRLVPYWYETAQERSTLPLLRFEDQAEVRALEMNAAIARFFDSSEKEGDMMRGATPGGAPGLQEMAEYRPGVSPSLNFLGLLAGLKALPAQFRHRRNQKGEELLRALLLATPSPTPPPTPSPSPTATPLPESK